MIFCVLGFVFSFMGSLDDGINSTVFRDFDTCYNPATKVLYGEQISNHTIHCMTNLVASQEEYTEGYNCVCASNGHHEQRKCIDVRLQHNSHNCEVLMTQMPALLLASCMLLLLLLLLLMFYCCISCKCVDFSDQTSVMPDNPVHTSAAYSEVCDVGVCELGEIGGMGDGSDIETPTVIVDSPVPSPAGTFCVPGGNSGSSRGSSGGGMGGRGDGGGNNSGGNTSVVSVAYPVERNGSLTLTL